MIILTEGKKLMKIPFLFIFCLIAFVGSARPQSTPIADLKCCESNCECRTQRLGLSDGEKYQIALKDALTIKPEEKHDLQVITDKTVSVSSFKTFSKTNDCNYTQEEKDAFNKGGIWVFLPKELRDIYQSRKAEFNDKGNRLKKLLGLAPEDRGKCIVEFLIDSSRVIRPFLSAQYDTNPYFWNKWGSDTSLFTGLGYTCDWYYGDGCRYGLTEFNIPLNAPPPKTINDYLKVSRVCTIDEYLENTCK